MLLLPRQILTSLEDRTVCQDLARLAALEMTLSETETITRFPHLTAGIFKQLIILSAGGNKEVGRICQTVLSTLLARLPFNQSLTLLNNTIKTDTKDRAVVALKNIESLVQRTEERLVRDHAKEIITGLLKVSEFARDDEVLTLVVAGLRQSGQWSEETLSDGSGDSSYHPGRGRSPALLRMSLSPEEKTPLAVHSPTEAEAVT